MSWIGIDRHSFDSSVSRIAATAVTAAFSVFVTAIATYSVRLSCVRSTVRPTVSDQVSRVGTRFLRPSGIKIKIGRMHT
jgi:hypothetical protein